MSFIVFMRFRDRMKGNSRNQMKKLHLFFGIIAGVLTLAAIVVAFILFVRTIVDAYTSFPAWAPVALVGIYYAIGLCILGVAWFCTWLILRYRACKK